MMQAVLYLALGVLIVPWTHAFPVYESCVATFPSGASMVSAFFSRLVEATSDIVQMVTADKRLEFSTVTLIEGSFRLTFKIPPIAAIDTVVRPIAAIPYAKDFLLSGLNSTTNTSLFWNLADGKSAAPDTSGLICVIIRLPAIFKDVLIGGGFLTVIVVLVAVVARCCWSGTTFVYHCLVDIIVNIYLMTFLWRYRQVLYRLLQQEEAIAAAAPAA